MEYHLNVYEANNSIWQPTVEITMFILNMGYSNNPFKTLFCHFNFS